MYVSKGLDKVFSAQAGQPYVDKALEQYEPRSYFSAELIGAHPNAIMRTPDVVSYWRLGEVYAPNAVSNPSFETDTAGWQNAGASAYDTFARQTGWSSVGAASLRLTKTGLAVGSYSNANARDTATVPPYILVTPGQTLSVQATLNVLSITANGALVQIAANFWDATGAYISSNGPYTTVTGVQTLTGTVVVPANARYTDLTVQFQTFGASGSASADFYVDNVQQYLLPPATDERGDNAGTYQGGILLNQPGALTTTPNPAVALDGSTGYVNIPDHPDFDFTTDAWVEAFVTPDVATGDHAAVTKRGAGGDAFFLGIYGGHFIASFSEGGGYYDAYDVADARGAPVAGRTYHMVGTWDGRYATLYVDGFLLAQYDVGSSGHSLTNSTEPVRIGSLDGFNMMWDGTIDEVVLGRRALTASEVLEHFNADTQHAFPGGIASVESFGTARVDQAVTPTGVATAEALGAPQVNLSVSPAGIASAEAFGVPTVTFGLQELDPTGIASAEAFGTARVDQSVSPAGIATAEAFGTGRVDQSVSPAGVASAEAFGAAQVEPEQFVTPSGITTIEAFGTARVDLALSPSGIASAEAFGSPQLNLSVAPVGIASAEAFGSARVDQEVLPAGIATAEALGAVSVVQLVNPDGLASAEAFGTARLDQEVSPVGIATAEAFGTAAVGQAVVAVGIATAETLGAPQVDLSVAPVGVVSDEAFGIAQLDQEVKPDGIASAEAFGTARLDQEVSPAGITSAEAFGDPFVAQTINAFGIGTAEALGALVLLYHQDIRPSGLASAEAFGAASVNPDQKLYAVGIPSEEDAPTPVVSVPANQNVLPTGIVTAEAWWPPLVLVQAPQSVSPSGIPTGEALGLAVLTALPAPLPGQWYPNPAHAGLPRGELFVPPPGNYIIQLGYEPFTLELVDQDERMPAYFVGNNQAWLREPVDG